MRDNKLKIVMTGVAGSIFAGIGSMADVLTGYTQNKVSDLFSPVQALSFNFLRPLTRGKTYEDLLIGDYLAVIFIPAAIAGVYHIHLILRAGSATMLARFFLPLATYAVALGAILHTKSTYTIASLEAFTDQNSNEFIAFIQHSFTPFGFIVVVLMFIIMLALAIYMAAGRTPYPKNMFWISPLMLQAYGAGLMALSSGALLNYLAVATWNLSMSIFFAASTLWYLKSGSKNMKSN
jgi:hypothetical protein